MSAELQETPNAIPEWIGDMEFCHVTPWDSDEVYCGDERVSQNDTWCPGEYNGEAICDACGRPTCPRCAQLSALDDAISDAAE